MRQTSPRIILCLLCIAFFVKAESQHSNDTPDASVLARIKASAINAANNYVEATLFNKQLAKRFIADSTFSLIICDDYKTFFNTNAVWCSPVGYEIAFDVVLETRGNPDTLHTNLFLPLDSSFKFRDSLADMWQDDLLRAWEKVGSKKYKMNYAEVLQFASQKRLHNYNIDFGYEGAGYKSSNKIFWFVTTTDKEKKNRRSFLYRIDPETGAVKVKKLLPVKLPKDVSRRR